MKQTYWTVIGITIGVILAVLFIPGIAEYIERALLSSMVGWSN